MRCSNDLKIVTATHPFFYTYRTRVWKSMRHVAYRRKQSVHVHNYLARACTMLCTRFFCYAFDIGRKNQKKGE